MSLKMSKVQMVVIGFSLLVSMAIGAEPIEKSSFEYQIQSSNYPDKTEFYFFRFNRESGDVQVLKYDQEAGVGKPVSWHEMRDKKSAFTYIIMKN